MFNFELYQSFHYILRYVTDRIALFDFLITIWQFFRILIQKNDIEICSKIDKKKEKKQVIYFVTEHFNNNVKYSGIPP
jgi:hypothetical protein